jgi:hypothetical protein
MRKRRGKRKAGAPARRSSKGGWTAEEDQKLREAVQLHQEKSWKQIGAPLVKAF